MKKIPLYKPYIGKEERKSILRVLDRGKLARGKEVAKLEKEFSKYVGQKYAVAVNSGTSGLHLAVRALGWKTGDRVITTPFSYIASANALLFEGIEPIFVDINPLTLNIDVEKIEEKITPEVKGILIVHVLGLPTNPEKIIWLKKKYKLGVLEDACEAVGRPSNEFPITKAGDITVFGFHENKQLTAGGEGGIIVTNNHLLADICLSQRDQGRATGKNWINKVVLGFNFRMTEIQAAFCRAQLRRLDKMILKRKQIAQKYSSFFKKVEQVIVPSNSKGIERSWFTYFISFKDSTYRNKVQNLLKVAGVSSSANYFPPIYDFPMYKNQKDHNFPHTEAASKNILILPTFYEMTDKQIRYVVNTINDIFKK